MPERSETQGAGLTRRGLLLCATANVVATAAAAQVPRRAGAASSAAGSRPLRFAVTHFYPDATTFNAQKAKIEDFPLLRTESDFARVDSCIRGFFAAIKDYPHVTLTLPGVAWGAGGRQLQGVDHPRRL